MLVIAKKYGQLGNRLFIFANVIACAIENNLTVVNPSFEDYASYFETTSKDFLCCYPTKEFSFVKNKVLGKIIYKFVNFLANKNWNRLNITSINLENDDDDYLLDSPKFLSLLSQKSVIFLKGWFIRDESNFVKHADKIRTYFTPIDTHQKNVLDLVTRIRESCEILIGVHIRHGDYEHFNEGKYFYSVEQYLLVMEQIEKILIDYKVAFLICSNVKKSEENFSKFDFTFANNHLIEDMYSLAKCDYIIGPPSTYTMWASFYGDVPLFMIQDPMEPLSLNSFSSWLSR